MKKAVKNVLSPTPGALRRFALVNPNSGCGAIGRNTSAIGCSLLLLLVTALSSSQEAQPGPAQRGTPDYTLKITVPVVTLEVTVLTNEGLFVPGLANENFRVLEDGEPQAVTSAGLIEAPITVVLLVEHTSDNTPLQQGALLACYSFLKTLKKDDSVALVLFDKRPHILQDFTQDKAAIHTALDSVGIPLSREISFLDALYDVLDRLEKVQGRKYVIVMASGADTLSRKILDQVIQKIQFAKETVIFSLGTVAAVLNRQAANQLRSFADMSGGKLYFPTSPDEYADAFRDMGRLIRNQYSISYRSNHKLEDGSWHKIKVEIVNADGSKPKYQISARDGYRARKLTQ
ncbi:MAG TPA: VWA domain-containing protein [Candidatus Angelobacter sp.]